MVQTVAAGWSESVCLQCLNADLGFVNRDAWIVSQKRDCQAALSAESQPDRDVDYDVSLNNVALFDSATGFANAHPGTDYASCPVTKCVINTGEGTCTGGMGPYGSYITMATGTPYGVVLA